jgi:polyphenol oxidase
LPCERLFYLPLYVFTDIKPFIVHAGEKADQERDVNMIEQGIGSSKILLFRNLYGYKEIKHFVSNRSGGVSKTPFDSMNLGLHVGDDREDVINNRKILASCLNIDFKNMTIAEQTHSGNVAVISEEQRGKGNLCHKNSVSNSDAMVTDVKNICIIILVADCVPIIFFDPQRRVIGVAHAGWRGSVRAIASHTVNTMVRQFGSLPEDIVAGIGPSIGPCCYKVGPEILSQVRATVKGADDSIKNEAQDGTGYLDLWDLNLRQLLKEGILAKNIEIAGICTAHNRQDFFSYRANTGETGRFGAGIELC